MSADLRRAPLTGGMQDAAEPLRRLLVTGAGGITVVAAAALAGIVVARQPSLVHALAALIAVVGLTVVALRSPAAAIVATLALLPFLALSRRLLIPFDGWQSRDPLLLVAPIVALVLLVHRHPARGTRLSSLVVALLVTAALESVNPLGGSMSAGIVGLLFVAAPLLWFFIGRDIADARLVRTVLGVVVGAATANALYGLSQTFRGFPSWDAAWVQTTGYAALNVGGSIRAFGGFSSGAEYGAYIGAAAVICIALALHGRVHALLLLPLLGTALFLEGSRGILLIAIGASVALVGLRTRRFVAAALVIAVVAVAGVLTWQHYSGDAASGAAASGNVFVQHQIGGIAHPLNTSQSTLPTHWHLFIGGLESAIHQPLGLGTGATNIAGSRFGGVAAGTEIDISNAFVALGLIGGCVFLGIVLLTLKRSFLLYRRRGEVLALAVVGVLLASLGQWLNGGYYALAPLVWLLIGWVESHSRANEASA